MRVLLVRISGNSAHLHLSIVFGRVLGLLQRCLVLVLVPVIIPVLVLLLVDLVSAPCASRS